MFDYVEHIYDDDDDATCNVCGYVRKFQVSKVKYEMSGYEYEGLVAGLVVSSTDTNIISGTYGQAYIVCTDEGCVFNDFSSIITDSTVTFMGKQTYYLVVIIGSQVYDISTLSKEDITLEGVGNPISLTYYSYYDYSFAIFKLETLYVQHTHTGSWVQEVPATCCEVGTKGHKICEICGKCVDENGIEITDLVIAIDEHSHSFGLWVEEIPATCSQTGTKGHKDCLLCHKHFDENGNEITDLVIAIDEHSHSFGQWIQEITATTQNEGVKAHKDCSNCSKHFDENGVEIEEITLPKLEAKLSSGAIAGIVIACVVVANCGVFALVWFVIKKKKFADLAKIFRKR